MSYARLPRDLVVEAYKLSMTPNLQEWTFVTEEVLSVTVHTQGATELVVNGGPSLSLQNASCDDLSLSHHYNPESERLHISLASLPTDKLKAGTKISVKLSFTGVISKEMRGFYRATFPGEDGLEKRMASTHFEPTSARHMYYCVDEPDARATFQITVTAPSSLVVLSNGPLLHKKEVSAELSESSFAPVEQIPPYLTALVVGEMEYIEGVAGEKQVPIRFFTRPGRTHLAKFALEVAIFSFNLFEEFFGTPYPLPKLDLGAIPDFPIGGMENWGLILLTETVLSSKGASVRGLKCISDLVSHEVSHNWFGNLVGISWWNGLWLKEGFASWCGYFSTDTFKPTWGTWDDWVESGVSSALTLDAEEATHPVEVEITNPSQITEIFDAISYDKGMAVVRMLEAHLGHEAFSKGMAAYTSKFSFKNTTSGDLWQVLEESSGVPVVDIMNGFTTQPGFPIVTVERVSSTELVFNQRRFKFPTSKHSVNEKWTIPLSLICNTGKIISFVLPPEGGQRVTIPEDVSWVKVNPGQVGYYRAAYLSPELWDSLLKEVASPDSQLSAVDRFGIQSDAFALYDAGEIHVTAIVNLLRAFAGRVEQTLVVLTGLQENLNKWIGIWKEEKCYPALCEIIKNIYYPAWQRLGSQPRDTDTPQDTMLRPIVMGLLASYGDETLLQLSSDFVNGENFTEPGLPPVDSNLMGFYLTYACTVGGASAFSRVFQKYLDYQDEPMIARTILSASGYTDDIESCQSLLTRCVNADEIRSQYGGTVFTSVAHSKAGKIILWEFFKENIDKILGLWGSGQFRLQLIIESVSSVLGKHENDAADFDRFFFGAPVPDSSNGNWTFSAAHTEKVQLE